ncbi:MAG TPA: ribbon-helix-helix protein, CopG family [Actinomycetota bacterium]
MARVKARSGTTLTRDRIDELAREAERGYELKEAVREPAKVGRPPLEEGVSPRISYRVGESLYERTKRKAKAEGRTVSEVARAALEQYVGR